MDLLHPGHGCGWTRDAYCPAPVQTWEHGGKAEVSSGAPACGDGGGLLPPPVTRPVGGLGTHPAQLVCACVCMRVRVCVRVDTHAPTLRCGFITSQEPTKILTSAVFQEMVLFSHHFDYFSSR